MEKKYNAVLLSGGGARAAYQVGVIKALSDIFSKQSTPLFEIFSGVSAGAINVAALSTQNDNWHYGADVLVQTWRGFDVNQIYKTDELSLLKTALPWIKTLLPFFKKTPENAKPLYFLDNEPLAHLLQRNIDWKKLGSLIEKGMVHACAVSCSSYHSGQSVTFFQGSKEIVSWEKERRVGVRTNLTNDHLLASSALPLIFPAKCINNEWFGDGSMRQIAPLSSCIHLGARKILVVGTGRNAQFDSKSLQHEDIRLQMSQKPYPSVAQIGGHILNGLFVDSLYADMERFARTNELIKQFGIDLKNIHIEEQEHRQARWEDEAKARFLERQQKEHLGDNNRILTQEEGVSDAQIPSEKSASPIDSGPEFKAPTSENYHSMSHLRNIDLFMLNPSQKIDEIASSYVSELPDSILKLLKRIGATEKLGGGLASYLLFESNYCSALIELGYADTWSKKEALREFFDQ